jgi:TatD DNase family protein
MKTEENIEVVKEIPLDRIMLETDCPYCEIRKSHASHQYVKTEFKGKDKKKYEKVEDSTTLVKGRNEPCKILQIAEVVAAVKGVDIHLLCQTAFQNSVKIFSK